MCVHTDTKTGVSINPIHAEWRFVLSIQLSIQFLMLVWLTLVSWAGELYEAVSDAEARSSLIWFFRLVA